MITEVTFRIRPMPDVRKYGSIVFPSFEPGVAFVREVARQVMTLRPKSNLFMNVLYLCLLYVCSGVPQRQ